MGGHGKAGKTELWMKHNLGTMENENIVFGNQNKMPQSQCFHTREQPLRKDYRDKKIHFPKWHYVVRLHGTLHWPQCCRQTLPVHISLILMTDERMILVVMANEISQKLVINKGLHNGSP